MLRYRLRDVARTPFPRPENMNPTLHALLVQRGVTSAEEAERFLNPRAEHLHDPLLLGGMADAVARIRRALSEGERICVYGDYDVDGVSASSLLSDYLRAEGGAVEVYLPSRHNEGYGLNAEAIEGIAARAKLMITVDCGVTSVELVELAKSLGLDCIVTDHHQPAEILPDCTVINPLLNGYPFPSLCGAGVAFKLVQALGGLRAALEYVDIAALATVADVVPLVDENRVIVRLGLERINKNPRTGLRALIEVSGLEEKAISAGNVAFQLAPRLNAGGRIGSARRSYDLLLARTPAEARPIAEELEQENRSRKDIEQQIVREGEAQLEDFDFPAHRILVLNGEGWNSGVIGLAASRFVEKYHYPAILLAEHDGVLTGSCRSIPGVDIHAALTAVKQHLVRYGGHKQAAGLTLAKENLDAFRRDIDAWMFENVPAACWIPEQEYDMAVSLDQLTEAFVAELDALQPTGFGNPAPVFRTKGRLAECRPVGQDGAHLRIMLSESRVQRAGIFFRAGHLAEKLPEDVDTLFSPKLNTFMGRTSVQLELKSIKSGDIVSEIEAKIKEENRLQHDFLTDMLYNKGINFFGEARHWSDLPGLKAMLEASPQGTLILTADLAQTREITSGLGDATLDLFVREAPDDPRAFNAVCCYPPKKLPDGYRRIVLAGAPDCIALPEGAEVYRLDMAAPWRSELPDVDQLREVYRQLKPLSARIIDDFELLTHHLTRLTGLSGAGAAAALLALHDLKLIELTIGPGAFRMNLCKMHKTDPDTSAVWRAVQAWRT